METTKNEQEATHTVWDSTPDMTSSWSAKESEEAKAERAAVCKKLAPPSLAFGLACTCLLYNNTASVAVPLFVLAAAAYMLTMMRQAGIAHTKRGTRFCLAVMLLLGVSDCLTDNACIIACNNCGIVLVLLTALLHNYCDDSRWAPGTWFTAMLRCAAESTCCLNDAARDTLCWGRASSSKNRQLLYALAGAAASAPLLALVIALLCSADGRYAAQLGWLADRLDAGAVKPILFFAASALCAYCSTRFLWKRSIAYAVKESRKLPSASVFTALTLFCAVYVSFACSQFTGDAGSTVHHAACAREGFFQLLAVSAINVIVVQAMLKHAKDGAALRVLLGVFCACTYLMAASAALRMLRYISYYGALTFLRVLVLWTLAVLVLLLTGQLVQVFRRDFPLFRYGFTAVCLCYLAISFARPDYWIASYNLSHLAQGTESSLQAAADLEQLARDTSCDAAPAFSRYGYLAAQDSRQDFNYGKLLSKKLEGKALTPRTWNFSRAQARSLMDAAPGQVH